MTKRYKNTAHRVLEARDRATRCAVLDYLECDAICREMGSLTLTSLCTPFEGIDEGVDFQCKCNCDKDEYSMLLRSGGDKVVVCCKTDCEFPAQLERLNRCGFKSMTYADFNSSRGTKYHG